MISLMMNMILRQGADKVTQQGVLQEVDINLSLHARLENQEVAGESRSQS